MTPSLRAFQDAVTASEGQKQSDLAGARSASAIKAAEVAHWQRIVAAGDLHGISTPNARDALAFHARGV